MSRTIRSIEQHDAPATVPMRKPERARPDGVRTDGDRTRAARSASILRSRDRARKDTGRPHGPDPS